MDRIRRAKIRSRLTELLNNQRTLLAQIEDLLDEAHVPNEANDPVRFRLGRLSTDYIRFVDELVATGLLHPADPLGPTRSEPTVNFSALNSAPSKGAGPRPTLREFAFADRNHASLGHRQLVLEILDNIGVPTSPMTIAQYARAVHDRELSPSQFASMRRDDRESFLTNPDADKVWVAAALDAKDLSRVPRLVAHSKWPLEKRIIAGNTVRLNHLRTILAMIDHLNTIEPSDKHHARLLHLVMKNVYEVHPKMADLDTLDLFNIRKLLLAELEAGAAADERERAAAAQAAFDAGTPPLILLWGKN